MIGRVADNVFKEPGMALSWHQHLPARWPTMPESDKSTCCNPGSIRRGIQCQEGSIRAKNRIGDNDRDYSSGW